MFGLFKSKAQREMEAELRELDRQYPSSCFGYDPDPEEGYDWGSHRRGEYGRRRQEIIEKYEGPPSYDEPKFEYEP